MGVPKISTFLIAIVWIGFCATMGSFFIANMQVNYGGAFDSNKLSTYNKLVELDKNVTAYKDSVFDHTQKSGQSDILGDFFGSGYKTLKLMWSSVDIFYSMLEDAFSSSRYSFPGMDYFKTSIFLTIVILIVVGVVLKALVKSDV